MELKEEFEKLQNMKEYVALATIDSDSYQGTNLQIIKNFIGQKIPGVYVTLNKPFVTIEENMRNDGIDTRTVIFIDAITETVTGPERQENCLFIGSPDNLTDLSIAVDQAVTSLPTKEKFIFFDSLSVLLIYNDSATVAKFIHMLAGKMHIWRVKGIIVSLRRKEDESLIKELFQFCDIKLDF